MRKLAMVLCLIVSGLLPSLAEAATCGSYSGVTRRCFFSIYKPCVAKHILKDTCHARADACRTCSQKLFICWKTLKSSKQCGTCTPAYSACMNPVIKGL